MGQEDLFLLRILQMVRREDPQIAALEPQGPRHSTSTTELTFRFPGACLRRETGGRLTPRITERSMRRWFTLKLGVWGFAVYRQTLRQALFCFDKGKLEIAVRKICAECKRCSLSKPGGDHRADFGRVILSAEPGPVVG